MKEEILLSVIVPIYNLEQYIERCIESIQTQSYRNIEILLVDDGSADDSLEICQKFANEDNRIRVFSQRNCGVTAARRKGILEATGEYITFVDGDDEILPDMYLHMMKHMEEVDMVSCGMKRYYSKDRVVNIVDSFVGVYTECNYKELLNKMIYDFEEERLQPLTPWLCNKIFRKDLLIDIFEQMDEQIYFAEDSCILYQYILKATKLYFVDKAYYCYHFRETSVYHSTNENALINVNRVYYVLKDCFRKEEMADSLLLQLQKWIVFLTMSALNQYMGFESQSYIPQFIITYEKLLNKRIALYGAGKMGRDIYWLLKKFKQDIVLWVDKDYRNISIDFVNIDSPNLLIQAEYDVVFICNSNEKMVDDIKEKLIKLGINKEKIMWEKPIRVY